MQETKYYKYIDIYKFIFSIIICCFYHFRNDFGSNVVAEIPGIKMITDNGAYFTEGFFIMSGMMLYKQLFHKETSLKFGTFFAQKYIRLIPMAAISSIVMFILQNLYFGMRGGYWLNLTAENCSVGALILQMSGIQFWGMCWGVLNVPVWYISVLLLCYIFYYFSIWAAKKTDCFFVALIPMILAITISTYGTNILFFTGTTDRGFISVGVGIICAAFLAKKSNRNILIVTMAQAVLIVVIIITKNIGNLTYELNFVLFPFLVNCGHLLETKLSFVNERATKFLAEISFTLYLFNLPIQLLITIIMIKCSLTDCYNTAPFWFLHLFVHLAIATCLVFVNRKVNRYFSSLLNKRASILRY